MKRVLVFHCQDTSFTDPQMGIKIRETLIFTLMRYGYTILSDDLYDPDWTVHLQKDEHEFFVVLVSHRVSHDAWSISLEDLNHKLLDKYELQYQLNPIIHEAIGSLPHARNLVWYDDFDFLKKV